MAGERLVLKYCVTSIQFPDDDRFGELSGRKIGISYEPDKGDFEVVRSEAKLTDYARQWLCENF